VAEGDSIARLAARLDGQPGGATVLRSDERHRSGRWTGWAPTPRPRHWVYGRGGRPCLRCGTPVAFAPAERTPHGRETWWCPRCQPG
jgi:hypothetical protein